jgi:hypothetical protein
MKIRFLIFLTVAMMLVFGFSSCDNEEMDEGFFNGQIIEMPETGLLDIEDEAIDLYIEQTEGASPAYSKPFHLLSTGQKLCYNAEGEIECPEPGEIYFGQDAQYSNGVRSFVDNGNETVTDDEMGHIWQKGFKSGVTWYEADNYCRTLTLNAKKWRVPTPQELRTLIDYGIYDPAIDTAAFPGTPSEWFWATRHSYFSDVASGAEASWIINFFDGFVEYTQRYNLYNVRCIRAN